MKGEAVAWQIKQFENLSINQRSEAMANMTLGFNKRVVAFLNNKFIWYAEHDCEC